MMMVYLDKSLALLKARRNLMTEYSHDDARDGQDDTECTSIRYRPPADHPP